VDHDEAEARYADLAVTVDDAEPTGYAGTLERSKK
jgi:hypothetical protein